MVNDGVADEVIVRHCCSEVDGCDFAMISLLLCHVSAR